MTHEVFAHPKGGVEKWTKIWVFWAGQQARPRRVRPLFGVLWNSFNCCLSYLQRFLNLPVFCVFACIFLSCCALSSQGHRTSKNPMFLNTAVRLFRSFQESADCCQLKLLASQATVKFSLISAHGDHSVRKVREGLWLQVADQWQDKTAGLRQGNITSQSSTDCGITRTVNHPMNN